MRGLTLATQSGLFSKGERYDYMEYTNGIGSNSTSSGSNYFELYYIHT